LEESFQAISCTGTDNHATTKRKYTKHKKTSPTTNKLALVNTQKHTRRPKPKTVLL